MKKSEGKPDEIEPVVFSVRDTGRKLSVSRSTVFALIRDRSLESMLIRGKRVVFADSLVAFLNGQR